AISIFFSALMAVTLTPALCAHFLKPIDHDHDPDPADEAVPETAPQPGIRGWIAKGQSFSRRFFNRFNIWFADMTGRYSRSNDRLLSKPMRGLAVFAALTAVTIVLFMRLPTAFLPT